MISQKKWIILLLVSLLGVIGFVFSQDDLPEKDHLSQEDTDEYESNGNTVSKEQIELKKKKDRPRHRRETMRMKVQPIKEEIQTPQWENVLQSVKESLDQDNWQQAEANLSEFLKGNPDHIPALVEMAMIQILDKSDSAAARPYYEKAVSLNPDSVTIIDELLNVYIENHSLESGLDFLKGLRSEQNDSYALDYGVAHTLYRLGKYEESVEFYTKVLETSGEKTSHSRMELANSYIAIGWESDAIYLLEEAMTDNIPYEEMRDIQIKLAKAYFSQEEYDKGYQLMVQWNQKYPEDKSVEKVLSDMKQAFKKAEE